jgi:hypothetical protein
MRQQDADPRRRGKLKSLVVMIVLGVSAYMTLKGAFAPARAFGLDPIRLDFGAKASDLPTLFGATAARGFSSRSSSRARSPRSCSRAATSATRAR